MKTTALFWTCLDCSLVGDGDRSAEAHTRKTGHTTITGVDPAALARMREWAGER